MKEHRASLLLGIAIPVLMILFIAGSIYLPPLFAPKPVYDFVYVSGDTYYDQQHYSVRDGRVVYEVLETPRPVERPEPQLFRYDVETNRSDDLTLEEAQAYVLDANVVSPDGYEFGYGSRQSGFFPFFVSSYEDRETRYLKGHGAHHKLSMTSNRNYYEDPRFLGWIID